LLPAALAFAAAPGVPELIQASTSGEMDARLEAIDSLGAMGEEAAAAVPALTNLLKDEAPPVRAHAARSLGMIGSAAGDVVPELMKLVGDDDPAVRRAAVVALRALRPGPQVTLPLLEKLLRDSDDAVRIRAMHELAEVGDEAVPLLIEALKDEETVYWACLVLGEIGPKAGDAVGALTELLKPENPQLCREAAIALGQIGPAAAPAVPTLARLLDDELSCECATYALGQIGPEAKAAEEGIKQNVMSKDPILRNISRWALAKLNPDDQDLLKRTVEYLVKGLTDEDVRVREGVVRAIKDIDPPRELLVPAFQKAMEGANAETVSNALDAIVAVGDPEVPRLIEALEYEGVRAKVVGILGRMGEKAAPAVGALVELIDDEDEDLRHEAFFALAKIGPAAKDAVPGLVKALKEGDATTQDGAAYALGKIGAAAADAKPDLLAGLESDDEMVPVVCAWALTMIDPECKESCEKTVPLLTKALAMPEPLARMEASAALARLGPLAEPAKSALEDLAQNDDEPLVREAAAEALKAIEGLTAEGIKPGATLVTAVDNAELTLGSKVIARLPKGTQVKVTEVRGSWIGVQVDVAGEKMSGWIKPAQVASP
jgi:HEAT repeat protein